MSIDWDKPLFIKIYGKEKRIAKANLGAELCYVACDAVGWSVNRITGEPAPSWMPRVYNKKPEPKTNEYWLCEGEDFNGKAVLRFHGSHWEGAYEEHGLDHITPIDKMERVEG